MALLYLEPSAGFLLDATSSTFLGQSLLKDAVEGPSASVKMPLALLCACLAFSAAAAEALELRQQLLASPLSLRCCAPQYSGSLCSRSWLVEVALLAIQGVVRNEGDFQTSPEALCCDLERLHQSISLVVLVHSPSGLHSSPYSFLVTKEGCPRSHSAVHTTLSLPLVLLPYQK